MLIAAADLLPALKERSWVIDTDLLTFAEEEALRALEEIIRRRPQMVALERQFAATPRGAALINRIKSDPTLSESELRVVAHDSDFTRVVPRGATVPGAQVAPEPASIAVAAPATLDQRGTRRAPRYKIGGEMSVLLDGNAAKLVDLSAVGAQVVSSTILKPNQRVRMALTDDHGALRFNAAIAWAAFEIPPQRSPRYRAGINFVDADSNAVGAFCMRHKQ